MPADKDAFRVPAMLADLAMNKRDGIENVVVTFGEHMLRCEPIARADECHAERRQCRRHEQHPFLVAIGPAAAMQRNEHIAVWMFGGNDGQRLIGIVTIGPINARNAAPKAQHLVVILCADRRERLLRRILVR